MQVANAGRLIGAGLLAGGGLTATLATLEANGGTTKGSVKSYATLVGGAAAAGAAFLVAGSMLHGTAIPTGRVAQTTALGAALVGMGIAAIPGFVLATQK